MNDRFQINSNSHINSNCISDGFRVKARWELKLGLELEIGLTLHRKAYVFMIDCVNAVFMTTFQTVKFETVNSTIIPKHFTGNNSRPQRGNFFLNSSLHSYKVSLDSNAHGKAVKYSTDISFTTLTYNHLQNSLAWVWQNERVKDYRLCVCTYRM